MVLLVSARLRDEAGLPALMGFTIIQHIVPRSASYELGRARGYVTGRAEPTERDAEWWAVSARLRLPCPAPPSPEALAAAREGSS